MITRMVSTSPKETKRRGALLAKEILKHKDKRPFVITLGGDLGTGKTTFAQGLARGLGVKRVITSPTFLIVRHYTLSGPRFKHFFHIDAYRIKNSSEVGVLGIRDICSIPESIVVVEWPERIRSVLPKNAVRITLRHGKKENERVLKIIPPRKK